MNFAPENFYHVYNRCFNKALLYYQPSNYTYFLKKVAGLTKYCDILAYCLMPNHFHLLLYLAEESQGHGYLLQEDGLTGMQVLVRKIGTILSSYTQAINKQEGRSGSLFQPKSKAKELNSRDQAFICFNYIHQNPLKARLVSKFEDWQYSSFNEYYRNYEGICNKSIARTLLDLPEDPLAFYKDAYEVMLE